MVLELNKELREQAFNWAKDAVKKIEDALKDPSIAIGGDELKIYEKFKTWGITTISSSIIVVPPDTNYLVDRGTYIALFTMEKYRMLESQKKTGNVRKPSKWEMVMGKVGRKP